MVTPQWRHRRLGFTPSRVDQMRQSLGQSIGGNNNKDQYTGMAACLNCIWSNINHCHCVFIDIVLDTFLIILGSTPSIDGQMGQVIWDRPFRETMTRTNSEPRPLVRIVFNRMLCIFIDILLVSDHKGPLLRKPVKWARVAIWGSQFGDTIRVGTNRHRHCRLSSLCVITETAHKVVCA